MLEVAAEPALDGRLQFAGEHTSSDFLGFMNGGVESGNRAAAALIKAMALHKNECAAAAAAGASRCRDGCFPVALGTVLE